MGLQLFHDILCFIFPIVATWITTIQVCPLLICFYRFQNKLVQKDYVYKSKYSGWYSVNDEAFVPETHVKDELRNGEQVFLIVFYV